MPLLWGLWAASQGRPDVTGEGGSLRRRKVEDFCAARSRTGFGDVKRLPHPNTGTPPCSQAPNTHLQIGSCYFVNFWKYGAQLNPIGPKHSRDFSP